ncbi:hypothetical protein [Meiothermus hypogaeus]|uniref:Gp5/Type VI secretion system Vgr protein OB-fold domain-containing protein n=2 Tax=Meiothermus hypogaeus TaxID=884155 RepID=A0A511QZ90_9DEIN|nr:hypothetical protein [Meiothermus hypogaeus]RIH79206.1 hypothetical protein Mhypo_01204 [Meiothermus hypogaeus]GEM81852.1 hypothetical protein MHY01S_00180 [Meiothermus hypogaeus NBRC 106114]GIW32389.1 MAG: hypothetical protein KatS3mg071_2563 [Meiothermus sp.]
MQERLTNAIKQLARPAHLDYLALYPGSILKDYEDMHVDVQVDDPRLGALTRVPIWLGLPGVSVKVSPGARVLVGFHRGDPEQRYCDLWRGEGLREVRLAASVKVMVDAPIVELAGGGPAVARVGDQIQVSGVQPGTATVTGTIISGSSKTSSG